MIGRRDLVALLGGAAIALACPSPAVAQQRPVVGLLHSGKEAAFAHLSLALAEGLKATGLQLGRDVALETRWGQDRYDRLPALAAELIARPVAVVVAGGSVRAPLAAKAASMSIPVVMIAGSDPVRLGLVSSFNRPGGNVTGISILATSLEEKRFGLLHELLPRTAGIAALVNPSNPIADAQAAELRKAAASVRQELHLLRAATEDEITSAFTIAVMQRAGAILVSGDTFFTSMREHLVTLAKRHALPAIYSLREFASAGGLMSYGTGLSDAYRQAGVYAGRILKGEKPADLPVLQPTKFELVINLRTAKDLGLEVPPMLLARADEVIE
jgi:putative ABC transport system substrate-binding protein